MIKINTQGMTKEQKKVFSEIAGNVMGIPVIFKTEPSSSDMKAGTVGKIKDAVDYIFIKFQDGKCVKIAVTEVT